MADIVQQTYTLKLNLLFVDGDTRTITLKNPEEGLTDSDFQQLNQWLQQKNILIGDKYGGTFGRIDSAEKVTKYTTKLDIT